MDVKSLFKFLLVIIISSGVMGLGFSFLLPPPPEPTPAKQAKIAVVVDDEFGWKFPVAKFPLTGVSGNLIAYSDIRDPGGTPQGLPIRLKIPAIGVDSAIEDAYITPDGRMDVPAGTRNVAWFALGPHPGKVGSAVIGGHFGNYQDNRGQAVFTNLDKLGIGSKVHVVDDNGNTLTFVVRRTQSFDRNADATSVFTSGDGIAHLNLITCEGAWNQVNDSYPQRLVVFTDFVGNETAVAQPQTVAVTKPTAAQEIAVKVTPTPTQPAPTSAPTETPQKTETAPESIPSSQVFVAAARSLYATPIDGIITSLLLFAVGAMSYKIVRRYRGTRRI